MVCFHDKSDLSQLGYTNPLVIQNVRGLRKVDGRLAMTRERPVTTNPLASMVTVNQVIGTDPLHQSDLSNK